MRPEQWEQFKRTAKGGAAGHVPLALIADSPWIPGHLGLSHLDYYFDPEVWFQANLRIMREFPEVIFFPSWWAELGMAAEPSTLGTRIRFWPDQTPGEQQIPYSLENIRELPPVNPQTDGLMPLILHRYERMKGRIFAAGYTIPVVAARGPLCTAAFFRGTTRLMMDLVQNPAGAHELLDLTTRLVIDWLRAQADAIGGSVEGILVLDDVVAFLGGAFYEEFAHPYLRRIAEAFPPGWVKVYHNDANVDPFLERLPETGFDVLNWGKNLEAGQAQARLGGRMRLMGNVNPLETGVRATPEEVYQATLRVLERTGGQGLILSLGGGISPGMPACNIKAMARAAGDFNRGALS